jgi:hypothetical protein
VGSAYIGRPWRILDLVWAVMQLLLEEAMLRDGRAGPAFGQVAFFLAFHCPAPSQHV